MMKKALYITAFCLLLGLLVSPCTQAQETDVTTPPSKTSAWVQRTQKKLQTTVNKIQTGKFGKFVGDAVSYAKDGIAFAKQAYEAGMDLYNQVKDDIMNSSAYKAAMISKQIAQETKVLAEIEQKMQTEIEAVKMEMDLVDRQSAAKIENLRKNAQIMEESGLDEDATTEGETKADVPVSAASEAPSSSASNNVSAPASSTNTKVQPASSAVRQRIVEAQEVMKPLKRAVELGNTRSVPTEGRAVVVDETVPAVIEDANLTAEPEAPVFEAVPAAEIVSTAEIVSAEPVAEDAKIDQVAKEQAVHPADAVVKESISAVPVATVEEKASAAVKLPEAAPAAVMEKASAVKLTVPTDKAKIKKVFGVSSVRLTEKFALAFFNLEKSVAAQEAIAAYNKAELAVQVKDIGDKYAPEMTEQAKKIAELGKQLKEIVSKKKAKDPRDSKEALEETQEQNFSKSKRQTRREERKLKKQRRLQERAAKKKGLQKVNKIQANLSATQSKAESKRDVGETSTSETQRAAVSTEVLEEQLTALRTYIELLITDLSVRASSDLNRLQDLHSDGLKEKFNLCDYTDPENVGYTAGVKKAVDKAMDAAQKGMNAVQKGVDAVNEAKQKVDEGIQKAQDTVNEAKDKANELKGQAQQAMEDAKGAATDAATGGMF